MPALLLGRRANRGLGPGRTDMANQARGELLFMLDADNDVYPTAFERLAAALDEDTGAAFAYSLIEAHTEGRPRGLLSASPWDPQRLRRGNYIDAMSMIRRSALLDARRLHRRHPPARLGGLRPLVPLRGARACAGSSSPRCSAATRSQRRR